MQLNRRLIPSKLPTSLNYHHHHHHHHHHHYHHRHHHNHNHINCYNSINFAKNPRIFATFLVSLSISSTFLRRKTTMVTSINAAATGGAFTTLSHRVTFEKEIKKSKFIAIASPIFNEVSAQSFLSEVRDNRASHNCWAYKIGDQYRSSDDGEPSGTAGKPMYSAIESSGIDRVMVVVIRHFGGIKLGTGGLVRAYGGVTSECLKSAPTRLVKSKVPMGVEVSFDLLGLLYHQLQSFQAEDVKQDYDTGKDGTTMVTFKVDFDKAESLEDAIKGSCGRDLEFIKS